MVGGVQQRHRSAFAGDDRQQPASGHLDPAGFRLGHDILRKPDLAFRRGELADQCRVRQHQGRCLAGVDHQRGTSDGHQPGQGNRTGIHPTATAGVEGAQRQIAEVGAVLARRQVEHASAVDRQAAAPQVARIHCIDLLARQCDRSVAGGGHGPFQDHGTRGGQARRDRDRALGVNRLDGFIAGQDQLGACRHGNIAAVGQVLIAGTGQFAPRDHRAPGVGLVVALHRQSAAACLFNAAATADRLIDHDIVRTGRAQHALDDKVAGRQRATGATVADAERALGHGGAAAVGAGAGQREGGGRTALDEVAQPADGTREAAGCTGAGAQRGRAQRHRPGAGQAAKTVVTADRQAGAGRHRDRRCRTQAAAAAQAQQAGIHRQHAGRTAARQRAGPGAGQAAGAQVGQRGTTVDQVGGGAQGAAAVDRAPQHHAADPVVPGQRQAGTTGHCECAAVGQTVGAGQYQTPTIDIHRARSHGARQGAGTGGIEPPGAQVGLGTCAAPVQCVVGGRQRAAATQRALQRQAGDCLVAAQHQRGCRRHGHGAGVSQPGRCSQGQRAGHHRGGAGVGVGATEGERGATQLAEATAARNLASKGGRSGNAGAERGPAQRNPATASQSAQGLVAAQSQSGAGIDADGRVGRQPPGQAQAERAGLDRHAVQLGQPRDHAGTRRRQRAGAEIGLDGATGQPIVGRRQRARARQRTGQLQAAHLVGARQRQRCTGGNADRSGVGQAVVAGQHQGAGLDGGVATVAVGAGQREAVGTLLDQAAGAGNRARKDRTAARTGRQRGRAQGQCAATTEGADALCTAQSQGRAAGDRDRWQGCQEVSRTGGQRAGQYVHRPDAGLAIQHTDAAAAERAGTQPCLYRATVKRIGLGGQRAGPCQRATQQQAAHRVIARHDQRGRTRHGHGSGIQQQVATAQRQGARGDRDRISTEAVVDHGGA